MLKYLLGGVLALIILSSTALAESMTWSFKSPAFHYGNGYSNHVLSVEQLQYQRRKEMEDEAASEAARLERELENTTLNKFIKNVESRIYATLSKQMVDSMFETCNSATTTCPTSGTTEIEGSTISWSKDGVTGEITLTVVSEDGSNTTITIPGAGEFFF